MLVSIGSTALGILMKGCNTAISSLGLAYFNCTTCVMYCPSSGKFTALLVSKRAPAVLPCASGTALTNLSPILTIVMPLSASTASRAWIPSRTVSCPCVVRVMVGAGKVAGRKIVRLTIML